MPSNDRIKKAAIGLVLAPMGAEVGSGLHLPLDGGK